MKTAKPEAAPEVKLVVYPRGPHTFDMALPDRTLLGMRLGHDADATADARRQVIAFLTAHGLLSGARADERGRRRRRGCAWRGLADASDSGRRGEVSRGSRRDMAPRFLLERTGFLVTSRLVLLLALTVALLAAPLGVEAQPAGKVPRIGVLNIASRSGPFFQAFDQGLRELGYVEGQNVAIEFRTAEGKVEKLASLATELVGLKVDVIVTPTEPAARAAKEATSTIPIVMVGINYDPIALGYVASLARPGGNVTGVFFRHIELTAKRLELFKEMLPTVKRVAVFSDPLTIDQLREVEAANTRTHFRLQPLELRHSPYDFGSAFGIAMRSHAEALFVLESSPIFRERMRIAQLASKNRLPTSFAFREYVEAGGLMAYGANFVDMARLAAVYVDKILKGAKPANLPVEQPTKYELVINLKTAKALGLTIPPSVLLRADQVIE